jgi:hypothetical protein
MSEIPLKELPLHCSLTMPRILGVEKKNRVRVNTSIEKELITAIFEHGLDIANTINLALEKHLREKHYI